MSRELKKIKIITIFLWLLSIIQNLLKIMIFLLTFSLLVTPFIILVMYVCIRDNQREKEMDTKPIQWLGKIFSKITGLPNLSL